MSMEVFIALCKEKIEDYLNSEEDYDIYTIWKDYWTVGQASDSANSINNQRGIFGTTLNNKYFDCTYNGDEHKLYMKIYDIDSTETYVINSSNS